MSFAFVRGFSQLGAQQAETPDWMWALLEETFGPVWDPCPHNPQFDGLAVDWKAMAQRSGKRQAYLNPEFKHIKQWLNKALHELEEHRFPSIFLIPFRPQTKYFAELILPNASEIRILSELIAFKGFDKPFKQRMCIVLLGKPVKQRSADLERTRPLYVDPSLHGQSVEQSTEQYVAARGTTLEPSPQNVPHTRQPVHGVAQRNLKQWLAVLADRPNTDIYSLLDDTAQTFITALLEPNAQAIVFWPRLRKGAHREPSQFCNWVIWGKPKPTRTQLGALDSLPPTFVWHI